VEVQKQRLRFVVGEGGGGRKHLTAQSREEDIGCNMKYLQKYCQYHAWIYEK